MMRVTKKHALAGLGLALVILTGATVARRPDTGPVLRTLTLGKAPSSVVVDGATGRAFVVDRDTDGSGYATGGGTVSLVDTRAGTLLRTVGVGPDPREAAVDPRSARVFVTNDDNATVSVLDAHSGALLGAMRVGSRPHSVAVDARAGRAYVVDSGEGSVSVLDTRRAVVLRTAHLGAQDFGLAGIAVDERTGHVLVYDTSGVGAGLRVLDARLAGVAHVATPNAATRPFGAGSYGGASYPSGLYGLYGLYGADHLVVDPTPVAGAPDGRVFMVSGGGLRVFDARGGRPLRTIAVAGVADAVAVDPLRRRVYVTSLGGVDANGAPTGAGRLAVIDERSGVVLRTIDAGMTPRAVAVDAGTGHVVVADGGGSRAVTGPWDWIPAGIRRRIPFLNTPVRTRAVPAALLVLDPNR